MNKTNETDRHTHTRSNDEGIMSRHDLIFDLETRLEVINFFCIVFTRTLLKYLRLCIVDELVRYSRMGV